MKKYSLPKLRRTINSYRYEGMGYPEWDEAGRCTWDGDADMYYSLTDKDLEKLINDGALVWCHFNQSHVPAVIAEYEDSGWPSTNEEN